MKKNRTQIIDEHNIGNKIDCNNIKIKEKLAQQNIKNMIQTKFKDI